MKEEKKLKMRILKNRVRCSRPGLAYALLRGWTVAYKVNVNHMGIGIGSQTNVNHMGISIGSQTNHGSFVKCSVRDPALKKEA